MKKNQRSRFLFLRLPALQLVFLAACVLIVLLIPSIFWSQMLAYISGGLVPIISAIYFSWRCHRHQKEEYSCDDAKQIVVDFYMASVWKIIFIGFLLALLLQQTNYEYRNFVIFGFAFSIISGSYINAKQIKMETI